MKLEKELLEQHSVFLQAFFFRYSQKDDYCYDYILLTLFTLTKSHHLQGVTNRPELQ